MLCTYNHNHTETTKKSVEPNSLILFLIRRRLEVVMLCLSIHPYTHQNTKNDFFRSQTTKQVRNKSKVELDLKVKHEILSHFRDTRFPFFGGVRRPGEDFARDASLRAMIFETVSS